MPRFLAIFTTVITLSAAGAQANNMVWQQHAIYAPNEVTVAAPINTEAPRQINSTVVHDMYANQLRINYAPISASYEAIGLFAENGKVGRSEVLYGQYGSVLSHDNSNITAYLLTDGVMPKSGWRGGEEIPKGGWRGGEEIPKGGWRYMVTAIADAYSVPNPTAAVPGTWGNFLADGKRSDPADAGDLLIKTAKMPTSSMDDVIQTMNYGWTADAMARTDPADAGYLLQPMLVAQASF